MEKFPSSETNKPSRAESEIENMSQSSVESLQDTQQDGIFAKLGKNPWVQRMALVMGLLSSGSAMAKESMPADVENPEQWLKDQQKVEKSIELTKGNLDALRQFLGTNLHSKRSEVRYGAVGTTGKSGITKQFEQTLRDSTSDRTDGSKESRKVVALTNDFFTAIRDAKTNMNTHDSTTRYFVDHGNDGSINRIIVVPGALSVREEQEVFQDGIAHPKLLATEAELASIERDAGRDSASLHRIVYDVDIRGNNITAFDFETGETTKNFSPHEISDKSPIEVMQMGFEAQVANARALAEQFQQHAK